MIDGRWDNTNSPPVTSAPAMTTRASPRRILRGRRKGTTVGAETREAPDTRVVVGTWPPTTGWTAAPDRRPRRRPPALAAAAPAMADSRAGSVVVDGKSVMTLVATDGTTSAGMVTGRPRSQPGSAAT